MDAFATAIAKEMKERGDLVEGRESQYAVTVSDIAPLKVAPGGRRLAGGVGAYVKFIVEPHNDSSVVMTILGDLAGGSSPAGLLAKCVGALRKIGVEIEDVAVDEPLLLELAVEVPPTPAPTPAPTPEPEEEVEESNLTTALIIGGVVVFVIILVGLYVGSRTKSVGGTPGEAAPLAAGEEAAAEPTERSMV